MKPKQAMPIIFILIFILISMRCDTNEPPENKASLSLTLEDISCTEAWLKLTTTDIPLPASIVLKQNDAARAAINLTTPDTLLYIDSLLPKQTYVFQVTSILNPASSLSSNQATATTLDTTSHNFSWQTWTFGQYGNSALYDVAIINENNIWAVGEIYMNDSLGNPDSKRYNLVVWDGNEWKVKRIPYNYHGSVFYHPIQSIFAFNSIDIWFCGNGIIRWDGQQFIEVPIPTSVWGPYQMNKLWGSSNDLYAVGNGGNIARYQNGVWTKIESETTVDLLDVWGSPDGSIVWACGENSKTVLLKIQNKTAKIVFEATFPMQRIKNRFYDGLLSLWTNKTNLIYVLTPFNLYRCLDDTKGEGKELYPKEDYFRGGYLRVRGKSANDIFTCGNKTAVWHYNGFSWYEYEELRNENQYLPGLDYKQNIVAAVGEKYLNTFQYQALIVLGKQ